MKGKTYPGRTRPADNLGGLMAALPKSDGPHVMSCSGLVDLAAKLRQMSELCHPERFQHQ
jgi:hypothetical protein